nr:MAG TPA: tail assembly chaperone protein [Caudoviricetes sp.]
MGIFKLKRPVTFEERKIEQFDLSGLEDLTGEEYATLLKETEKMDGADMVPEKSLTFAFLAAAKVTGEPFDLFKKMGAKDTARLRYEIGSFFLAED